MVSVVFLLRYFGGEEKKTGRANKAAKANKTTKMT